MTDFTQKKFGLISLGCDKNRVDAEKLLALPKEFYAEVERIAKASEGRAILRATEIFAKTENELRFASSPRIALETAILRAAMPQTDLDTDALLLRVAALEKQLAALAAGAPVQAHAQPAANAVFFLYRLLFSDTP